VDGEERLDEGFALGEPSAELAAPFSARADDVLEAGAVIGEFLADGAAEELPLMVDAQFGHVARVEADDDILADIGGQREVDVAQRMQMNPVLVDLAGFRHREQQEVKVLQGVRQAGEEATGLPARQRRQACLPVDALVVHLDDEAMQALVQFREGHTRGGRGGTRRRVAGQRAEEELIDGLEETLDLAAPTGLPLLREDQAHLQVGGNLFQVPRREVRPMVGVEDAGDAADPPVGVGFVPNRLTQGERRLQRCGRVQAEAVADPARL